MLGGLIRGDAGEESIDDDRAVVRAHCLHRALLFVGFAHQPQVIQTSAGPIDVSQYVLPDGSLPIFCITDNSDDGSDHGKIHMVHGCEACQITATVVIPAPSDVPSYHPPMSSEVAFDGTIDVFSRPLFPRMSVRRGRLNPYRSPEPAGAFVPA